jgi:hypothetical protein
MWTVIGSAAPMFQRTTVPSCSWSSSPKSTTTLQNVRNYSPNDTVSHITRLESSETLLWEPKILNNSNLGPGAGIHTALHKPSLPFMSMQLCISMFFTVHLENVLHHTSQVTFPCAKCFLMIQILTECKPKIMAHRHRKRGQNSAHVYQCVHLLQFPQRNKMAYAPHI